MRRAGRRQEEEKKDAGATNTLSTSAQQGGEGKTGASTDSWVFQDTVLDLPSGINYGGQAAR